MASKDEFYESISVNTFVGAEFCWKLYGYCLTDDTFLEKVMDKFKSFGRDKVIYIYSAFVTMYIHFQMKKEKEASAQNSKRIKKEREERERKVKQEEWKKVHSVDTAQNSCLQRQKEKLMELKKKLQN